MRKSSRLSRIMAMVMTAFCVLLFAGVAGANEGVLTQDSPFRGEGVIVEGAAATGSIIGGIAGLVVGIPVGIVIDVPVGIVSAVVPSAKPRGELSPGAAVGSMCCLGGLRVGEALVAGPVFIAKKVAYDAPRALLTLRTEGVK